MWRYQMGRGELSRATGEKRGLSFGKGGGGGEPSLKLLPARINRTSNTGDLNKMIKGFAEKHSGAPREYGAFIDEYGYATGYYEGKTGSVSFPSSELPNRDILHNHPRGGWANFSGQDLTTFAESKALGITAVSKHYVPRSNASEATKRAAANRRAGTYVIRKTGRFKKDEFVRAIHNVKVRSNNYDKDLSKWLAKNQQKYGYKYSYKPAKK